MRNVCFCFWMRSLSVAGILFLLCIDAYFERKFFFTTSPEIMSLVHLIKWPVCVSPSAIVFFFLLSLDKGRQTRDYCFCLLLQHKSHSFTQMAYWDGICDLEGCLKPLVTLTGPCLVLNKPNALAAALQASWPVSRKHGMNAFFLVVPKFVCLIVSTQPQIKSPNWQLGVWMKLVGLSNLSLIRLWLWFFLFFVWV